MKKTLIALTTVGLMGSSMAFASVDNLNGGNDPFNNHAYVGVHGTVYKTSQNFAFKTPGSVEHHAGNVNESNKGAMFGLQAGYGTDYKNGLYLGGEVGASYALSPTGKAAKPGEGKTKFYAPYQFYADFMPGYKLSNDVLLYGRVGLAVNDYHLDRYYSNGTKGSYTPDSKIGFGVRLGVGLEYAMSDNLSVRAGVTYVQMMNIKIHQAVKGTNKDAGTSTAKPNYWLAGVGINYRFGM